MAHISVVSPVYMAENIVDELVRRIIESVSKITEDFEIILVEDGSPDNSWKKIVENCKLDKRVKGLKLSRNFGQHHAITAGLDYSNGDWVVVMDCDLQDQPEEIIRLYEKAQEGFDIVFAEREKREDPVIKKYFSKIFYRVFSYLSDIKQNEKIANFGIYSKKVISVLKSMREPLRSFSPMVRWVGFKKAYLPVVHAKRFSGKSSYNFKKLLNLALEISLSYSDKPLKMIVKFGFLISLISFLVGLYFLVKYFIGDILVSGFTSIIVSLFFLSGLILLTLGILGLYIGKIFEGVKSRPIYIIEESLNVQK